MSLPKGNTDVKRQMVFIAIKDLNALRFIDITHIELLIEHYVPVALEKFYFNFLAVQVKGMKIYPIEEYI